MRDTKLDECEQLFTLGEIENHTVEECATIMQVSVYHIRQLRKDPDYIQVRELRRSELKERAFTRVHALQAEVLTTMQALLYARSELVRFNAAAKLGDWVGLGQMVKDSQDDDRGIVNDFLKTLIDRAHFTVTVDGVNALPPPAPGGQLPEFQNWKPEWEEQ